MTQFLTNTWDLQNFSIVEPRNELKFELSLKNLPKISLRTQGSIPPSRNSHKQGPRDRIDPYTILPPIPCPPPPSSPFGPLQSLAKALMNENNTSVFCLLNSLEESPQHNQYHKRKNDSHVYILYYWIILTCLLLGQVYCAKDTLLTSFWTCFTSQL